MAKEKTTKKETEGKTAKRPMYNNNAHVFGFINGVRMNDAGNGRTAINLDVASQENFKVDDKKQTRNTYHDIVLFTSDKNVIESFKKIAGDLENNAKNKDVKDFKRATHTISVDGILMNRNDSVQILTKEDGFKLDTPLAEKEVRNRADIVGNVGSLTVHEEKNFATASLIHHYRPEGSEKDFETSINIRVDGDRKFSKETYEKMKSGEIGVGDFIRVGGQLHNNNYENEKGKRYSMALDVTSSSMIRKKGAAQEQKAEPKATTKKAAAEKPAKKATSRKKTGVKI